MKENDLIFGIRAVIEAIQADKEIDKILIRRDLQSNLSRELFEVLKGRSIPVQRVPGERLDRLTRKNHQGVIAFMAAVTYQHLEDLTFMNKAKIRSSCCWTASPMSATSGRLPVPANVPVSTPSSFLPKEA